MCSPLFSDHPQIRLWQFAVYQINYNQGEKEVRQSKLIIYNKIPITGEVEENHNQETTTSSSNKKCLDDKSSWMDLKTEEMSAAH